MHINISIHTQGVEYQWKRRRWWRWRIRTILVLTPITQYTHTHASIIISQYSTTINLYDIFARTYIPAPRVLSCTPLSSPLFLVARDIYYPKQLEKRKERTLEVHKANGPSSLHPPPSFPPSPFTFVHPPTPRPFCL